MVERKILNSWKEISMHLGRGVRTVQRWEALFEMPVHRPAGKSRSAVVAFSDELDAWLSSPRTMAAVSRQTASDAMPLDERSATLELLQAQTNLLAQRAGQLAHLLSQLQTRTIAYRTEFRKAEDLIKTMRELRELARENRARRTGSPFLQ